MMPGGREGGREKERGGGGGGGGRGEREEREGESRAMIQFYTQMKTITSLWREEDAAGATPTVMPTMK